MSKTTVRYEQTGEVGTIWLVPPDGKPPTLDGRVMVALERCILEAGNSGPRLVIVRSKSDRFFCVGADINVLEQTDPATIVPWVMEGHRVLNMLEDLPVPVVAVVNGYAMGGGLELALACDLIFASTTAQFAQSEAGLGFIPGWGGTRRLSGRIGHAKAKYYFYTGKMLDAKQAADIGLIDFVSDTTELDSEVSGFTQTVLGNNANALSQFKKILNDDQLAKRNENATVEAFRSISCLQDADTKQRMQDFLEKRKKK